MKQYLLILVLAFSVAACKKKTNTVDQAAADDQAINKYITDNKLTAKSTSTGLYYVIKTQGAGTQPNSGSTVTVNYKGYLLDGTVFDQSKTGGYTTPLSNVIAGWQQGIPQFKKGTTGTLLIPSALGYGAQATGSIPANSVLIFDITVLDVK